MKHLRLISRLIFLFSCSGLLVSAHAGPSPAELQAMINKVVTAELEQFNRQMGVVINLSGRQRMLTQKMSKEMLLIYHGIDPQLNRTNLGNSALMFAETLQGLINGDKALSLAPTRDQDILKQMNVVSSLWQSFSKTVLAGIGGAEIDLSFIEKVAKENLPLLKEMNTAVYMYERAAGADLAKLAPVVNLSGRQRMLTQKMTKELLLIAAGVSVEENKANLSKTVALFDRTLIGLRDGDPEQRLPGTEEPLVRDQLAVIEKHWKEYKPVLEKLGLSEAGLRKAAALNLPLLKEMNTAVKMYEVLSDNS